MKAKHHMRKEIRLAGIEANLPADQLGQYCKAVGKVCMWEHCPQNRDGEPGRSGRHCLLDIHKKEREQGEGY